MLVVATLVTILIFPVLIRDALQALQLPNAYAATGPMDSAGRVYQNGNNGDDDDDNDNDDDDDDDGNNDDGNNDDDDNDNENNDESDNEGEDNENDNVVCYASLNDNEDEVACDFDDDGIDNGNYDGENDNAVYSPPAPASGSLPASRSCFDVGQIGNVQLNLEGGTITIQVVPASGLTQATWLELDDIEDLNALPAPPAGTTMLDRLVWRMNAGTGCDGAAIGTLSGAVNLGIPYNVPADKSKLQIVMIKDGVWVEVLTVPDPSPSNPYISSTVRETGIYAVIQKP